jgi:hypothetical protein
MWRVIAPMVSLTRPALLFSVWLSGVIKPFPPNLYDRFFIFVDIIGENVNVTFLNGKAGRKVLWALGVRVTALHWPNNALCAAI